MGQMLKVTYINREPRKTGFSIEGIFALVKDCLKGRIEIGNYDMNPAISWIKNIRTVKKYAGDINHITGDINFLLLGLRGYRNLLTIHDMGHYDTLRGRSKIKHVIYHWFWFYLPLKNASYVTVISEFTKGQLLKYFSYPEDRIRIIYDPVKPIFTFQKKEQLHSTPRILQIGSGKHKNLEGLIDAVKGMDVHLDIVAWIDDATKARMTDMNIAHTIYNGLTDQALCQLYANSDILFFASFYEGFGMPIIEAQAVGRPVITSNIGAMKEVAGTSALLVDPGNTKEIKRALERLLTDRNYYEELVQAGLENIKQYHHDKIANDYLAVYNEMMQTLP